MKSSRGFCGFWTKLAFNWSMFLGLLSGERRVVAKKQKVCTTECALHCSTHIVLLLVSHLSATNVWSYYQAQMRLSWDVLRQVICQQNFKCVARSIEDWCCRESSNGSPDITVEKDKYRHSAGMRRGCWFIHSPLPYSSTADGERSAHNNKKCTTKQLSFVANCTKGHQLVTHLKP